LITNLFTLLALLALTILCGWLTVRAVRAHRLWVKIAGGAAGGLLTLLLGIVVFFGASGFARLYTPGAPPASVRAVTRTDAQIARGDYLVNLSCIGCHSAVGSDGNPSTEHPLNGGWNIAAAEGFGFIGDMVAANLTPGDRLGDYSDGEIFRVLRHGVDREGRLLGFMSLLPYSQLSDADTEAIVAYLRTLQPVPSPGPTGDNLNFLGMAMFGAGLFGAPPAFAPGVVTAPPPAINAEYGAYVATFAECRGCHGADATGAPASAVGPAVPNPRPLVSTLSPEQFATMMRSGVRPGGAAFPPTMPWQVAAGLTDEDLTALYLYLTAPLP
jgi:mono/diheme cytochrome c family protein